MHGICPGDVRARLQQHVPRNLPVLVVPLDLEPYPRVPRAAELHTLLVDASHLAVGPIPNVQRATLTVGLDPVAVLSAGGARAASVEAPSPVLLDRPIDAVRPFVIVDRAVPARDVPAQLPAQNVDHRTPIANERAGLTREAQQSRTALATDGEKRPSRPELEGATVSVKPATSIHGGREFGAEQREESREQFGQDRFPLVAGKGAVQIIGDCGVRITAAFRDRDGDYVDAAEPACPQLVPFARLDSGILIP